MPDENSITETRDWNNIARKRVRQTVSNLQKRIYKAAKPGKHGKAKNLARPLQPSTSGTLPAVRRATTDNTGGVDFKKRKTPKEKIALAEEVLSTTKTKWDKYKPMPTKRATTPKANGKTRPLGIPTIKDRATQAATKQALEPMRRNLNQIVTVLGRQWGVTTR